MNGDSVDVVSGDSITESSMRSSYRNDPLRNSLPLNSKMSPRQTTIRNFKHDSKKKQQSKKNVKRNFIRDNLNLRPNLIYTSSVNPNIDSIRR